MTEKSQVPYHEIELLVLVSFEASCAAMPKAYQQRWRIWDAKMLACVSEVQDFYRKVDMYNPH